MRKLDFGRRLARWMAATAFVFGAAQPAAHAAVYEVLHAFNGADGSCPFSSLIKGRDGYWWGVAMSGGAYGGGTLYRWDRDFGLVLVHNFDSRLESIHPNGLLLADDGLMYGSTNGDAAGDGGSVFVVGRHGRVKMLHRTSIGFGTGTIALGTDGLLYGTVGAGGPLGNGYLYSLTRGGEFNVLYSFDGSGHASAISPNAPVVQGPDGALYGTTRGGGAYGQGTVYRVTPGGQYTELHAFGGRGPDGVDGEQPFSGLVLGRDGLLYGTTSYGGANSAGVLFRISITGSDYTVVTSLAADGSLGRGFSTEAVPMANGQVLGITDFGGSQGRGTLIAVKGRRTVVLHSLAADGSDGYEAYVPPVRAQGGELLGTMCRGGPLNAGTLYRLDPSSH